MLIPPSRVGNRSVVLSLLAVAGLASAPRAVAVEPIPDYKTLVFPSIISKAGSSDPAPNSDPGTIRNNYENYYENFWKDISYYSYNEATGVKERGLYIDTKTYGYIHMPWSILPVSNLPADTYTGPAPRVMGAGEAFNDGERLFSDNLAAVGLAPTPDGADADGFWTPGESFQDAYANNQYDPYRPGEDYWNNDNTTANLQRRNAAGVALGNLGGSTASGGPLNNGAYRGPAPDNNVDTTPNDGVNDWNANAGELFADYNEDTDLTNDTIGYDTAVTIFLANGAVQVAKVMNELDLSPQDDTSINEGDFAHTLVTDPALTQPGTPTDIPRNGVFDYTTTAGDLPQVRRAAYRNGNLLFVLYTSYVRTNATTEAASNPPVYGLASVVQAAGAPPANAAPRLVRVPVYQAGELYGRVKGATLAPPAREYGDIPAGNNNVNLYPNTREILADSTWTPPRAAELFEDYLVFGGPGARYRADLDPAPAGPQRPGRNTNNPMTAAEYADYITWNYPGAATALIARAGNGQYDGPEEWSEWQDTKVTFNTSNQATFEPGIPGLTENWAGALFGFPTWQDWWEAAFNSPAPAWNPIVAPSVNIYAPNSGARADGWIPGDSWGYDSDREFCDMPSSLYHIGGDPLAVTSLSYDPLLGFLRTDLAAIGSPMGDQWIGEITSPWGTGLSGQDVGPDTGVDFVGPSRADNIILPGGPFTFNGHGNNGHDAANVLGLEVMTWRRTGDRAGVDAQYPENLRDVNLDAFLDTGNGRVGDISYATGQFPDGSGGYPFNRMRYMEDLIELWDGAQDFNDFPLLNPDTGLPFLYGFGIYEQTENAGSGSMGGPAGATTTFITRDRVDPIDILFQIRPIEGGELDGDIPTGTGIVVSNQVNGANFGMGILCHEQGHDLLGYPDLYDYDVWNGQQATLNRPIGAYDLMSGGGLVHGIADFKIEFGAQWATPVDINSLVGLNAGPVVVEMYPAEDFGENSYFRYNRPGNTNEYFYFYYYGSNSPYAPTAGGPGIYITHTDLNSNPNGVPNQQRVNNHYTWEIIQADGLYHLADGVNSGDEGDPFPGAANRFIFTEDTTPSSRWWDQTEAGIRILDIALPTVPGQPALVTFERFDNTVAQPIVPTFGSDLDNDGMPDAWEVHYWGNTTTSNGTGDFDFDGLSDLGEFLAGTNPTDNDSDNNGTLDGAEDSDTDGVANQDEIRVTSTNPGVQDTDDDGFSDGDELNATVQCGDRFLTSPSFSNSPLIERCLFLNGTAMAVPASVLPSQPDRFDNLADAWTLEAWVRPAGLESGSIIRRTTTTGRTSFELFITNNIPSVRFTTLSGGLVQAGGTVAIPAGEWTHLAGVWDNASDTLSLFVNGVSYRAQTSLFSPAQGRGSVVIGDGVQGRIDEVRIWRVARTAAQVVGFANSIIESPSIRNPTQLVAYYRFDDGGSIAEDSMHPITSGSANVNNRRYGIASPVFDAANCVMFCQIDDFNANGISDWYENLFFAYVPGTLPDPNLTGDNDGDGLLNRFEYHADSNPKDDDSDNDGIVDGAEDRDGDLLTNLREQDSGTHPLLIDTDDDGRSDNQEVAALTNGANSLSPLANKVLTLNGSTNTFAELPRQLRYALTNFTVEAWVRLDAVGTPGTIIARQVEAGVFNYKLSVLPNGQVEFRFTRDSRTGDEVLVSPQVIDIGVWTHVAAVYGKLQNTGRMQIQINGQVIADRLTDGLPASGGVGPVWTRVGAGIDGSLDEVHVWSIAAAARTLAQVQAVLPAGTAGLVSNFRFDDGTFAGPTSGKTGWITGQAEDYMVANDWLQCWSSAATLRGGAQILPESSDPAIDLDAIDTDGDGMPDGWEISFGLNPLVNDASVDADGDGLTNLQEYLSGTHPWIRDTDGDGFTDGNEDLDGDGLTNLAEVSLHNTLPNVADTDDDGYTDFQEVTGLASGSPNGQTSPVNGFDPVRRQSMCFTGTGRVEIPDQVRHNLDSWTIHGWVKPEPGATGIVLRRMIRTQIQQQFFEGVNYELGVYNDAGTLRAYVQYAGLALAGGPGLNRVRVDCQQNAEVPGYGYTRGAVPPGVWTHIAGVYDQAARTLKLYVNGELLSYRTDAAPPTGWNADAKGLTTIGGGTIVSSVVQDGFEGCIDDVMIVPRAVDDLGICAYAKAASADQAALLASATLLQAPGVDQPGFAQALQQPHVANEFLVRFKTGVTSDQQDASVSAWGFQTKRKLKMLPIRTIRIANGADLVQAMNAAKADPSVAYVQPNYKDDFFRTPNDPRFGEMWGLHNIGQTINDGNGPVVGVADADTDAPDAWDGTTGSQRIIVAVNDSGVDISHPDLAANIWTNPGEIAGNGIDDDGNGYIDDIHGWDFVNDDPVTDDAVGHGTHVAGTIGAVGNNGIGVVGVNWNVAIMPCKIGDDTGIPLDAQLAGLEYAIANGARVSNHSYGGFSRDPARVEAVSLAASRNHLLVIAAGNSASNNDTLPVFPTNLDFPNVISVAAIDNRDQLAVFSNYGLATVDIAAPGVAILSTTPGTAYEYYDGTSMAAPHVAGAAALVLSKAPDLHYTALRSLLLNSARPLASLQGFVASGRALNVGAAVSFVAPVGFYTFDDGGVTVEDATTTQDWLTGWERAGIITNGTLSPSNYAGITADSDGDLMPDWWEISVGLDPNNGQGSNGATGDQDTDGLQNLTEYQGGTHPYSADSDQDGIRDGLEDNDADGITAIDEQNIHRTHAGLIDTDDDGLNDKLEVNQGYNPADSLNPAAERYIVLDGAASTHLVYPNHSRFNLTSWTIDMQVKIAAYPATNAVLFARNLLRKDDITNYNYFLGMNASGQLTGGFTSTAGPDVVVVSDAPVPLNSWTWISVAFDHASGKLSLLVNGSVIKTLTTPQRPVTSDCGEATVTAGSGFNGCVDEIRLWSADRSAMSSKLNRPVGTEASLVSWVSFNDGTFSGGTTSGETGWTTGQAEEFVSSFAKDWNKNWANAASFVGNVQSVRSSIISGITADCATEGGLDVADLPWSTGAFRNSTRAALSDTRKYWFCQSVVTYLGNSALQSGGVNTGVIPNVYALGDCETSWLQTQAVGPGKFCFKWKCVIEPPAFAGNEADYLNFYVNGSKQAFITGDQDWTNLCVNVSAGIQTLRWEFTKDRFGAWPTNVNAAIKDSVFIDDLQFVHTGPDTDADGLPDAYETSSHLAFPLGSTNPNNPDTDGDGLSDGDEVAMGTSPTVANTPEVATVTFPGGKATITWTGTAGLRYLVQKSYDNVTWVAAPNGLGANQVSMVIAPANGTLTYCDPASPESGPVLYRVLILR